MITVSNLTFEYRSKRVLHDVSFDIEPNTVTALVGPNGAGKTTLLRCLAALDAPFAGVVRIGDHDTVEQPRRCHRQVGYLSDFFGLYDALTVRQSLTYVAFAHHLPAAAIPARISGVATSLGLADRLDARTGELSRGLRQRVAIAMAIIHRPDVLLLDEPASGLDPEARHALAALLLQLRADGMTILVSSHILAELEEYSTHMLVLRDGHIRGHQRLEAGGAEDGQEIVLRVRCADGGRTLAAWLRGHAAVRDAEIDGADVRFRFTADPETRQALLREMIEARLPVLEFAEQRQNLQDLYLAETGVQ